MGDNACPQTDENATSPFGVTPARRKRTATTSNTGVNCPMPGASYHPKQTGPGPAKDLGDIEGLQ